MRTTKHYLHPFLDSSRWDYYEPRANDIIIATPFKSGTTWMQMIVLNLIYKGKNQPLLKEVDHWIDLRLLPVSDMVEKLQKQQDRRFIKTHLPADAIPIFEQIKYIVVDRDPRDVFMSLYNHYKNLNIEWVNNGLPNNIMPLPKCPTDISEFWSNWLTKGYFDWETEGFPFWSNLRHVQTWFDKRAAENVIHVHFNNLLQEPKKEILRVADYLGFDLSDYELNLIVERTSFDYTKDNLENLFPNGYGLFDGGANTFFHKGTNQRWKGLLGDKEVELFTKVTSQILTKECREWLIR